MLQVGLANGVEVIGGAIHEIGIHSAMHMKIDEAGCEVKPFKVLVIVDGALVKTF